MDVSSKRISGTIGTNDEMKREGWPHSEAVTKGPRVE